MNNCWLWAYAKWRKCGGYILLRKSRFGWWWHALWASPDLKQIEHFVPDDPKKRLLPPPVFKGHIKHGDE